MRSAKILNCLYRQKWGQSHVTVKTSSFASSNPFYDIDSTPLYNFQHFVTLADVFAD